MGQGRDAKTLLGGGNATKSEQSGESSFTINVKVFVVEEPLLNTAVWSNNDMKW